MRVLRATHSPVRHRTPRTTCRRPRPRTARTEKHRGATRFPGDRQRAGGTRDASQHLRKPCREPSGRHARHAACSTCAIVRHAVISAARRRCMPLPVRACNHATAFDAEHVDMVAAAESDARTAPCRCRAPLAETTGMTAAIDHHAHRGGVSRACRDGIEDPLRTATGIAAAATADASAQPPCRQSPRSRRAIPPPDTQLAIRLHVRSCKGETLFAPQQHAAAPPPGPRTPHRNQKGRVPQDGHGAKAPDNPRSQYAQPARAGPAEPRQRASNPTPMRNIR